MLLWLNAPCFLHSLFCFINRNLNLSTIWHQLLCSFFNSNLTHHHFKSYLDLDGDNKGKIIDWTLAFYTRTPCLSCDSYTNQEKKTVIFVKFPYYVNFLGSLLIDGGMLSSAFQKEYILRTSTATVWVEIILHIYVDLYIAAFS